MLFLNFLRIALRFTTFLFILSVIFFFYIIFKGYQYTRNISKKVYELGKGVTHEKIEDYIAYIDTKYIPFYATNFVKAGYKLIDMDESIDENIKKNLKIIILGKGILVD